MWVGSSPQLNPVRMDEPGGRSSTSPIVAAGAVCHHNAVRQRHGLVPSCVTMTTVDLVRSHNLQQFILTDGRASKASKAPKGSSIQ